MKDPIFNTPYLDHGTVMLTTDWSGIGSGLTAFESYTVTADTDYTATLTGMTNKLDLSTATSATPQNCHSRKSPRTSNTHLSKKLLLEAVGLNFLVGNEVNSGVSITFVPKYHLITGKYG